MLVRIELIKDLPVDPKHGMKKGRILDVVEDPRRGIWVIGDNGDRVKILPQECRVVKQEETNE